MNKRLRVNISNMGEEVSEEIKSGRKAKKNMDNFGFRIFIKKPLVIICHNPFLLEGESNFNAPVSFHIPQAR